MLVDQQVALLLCRAVPVLHSAASRPADGAAPYCLTNNAVQDLQGWPSLELHGCSAASHPV